MSRHVVRAAQPSVQALEPPSIVNALDLALAPRHMPLEARKAQTGRKAANVDIPVLPFNPKAAKAIIDICDRYDRVIGKPLRVSWDFERHTVRLQGQSAEDAEAVESQASTTLTKRSHFLQHLSYSMLTVAYSVELQRTKASLETVATFLSERGFHEMAKSIRAAKHAIGKPVPKLVSPRDGHLAAGAPTINTLRREADWLRQRERGPTDKRNDAMVQRLEECATAAGRVYRLAIEREITKLDDDVAFRTKQLSVREALVALDMSRLRRTAEGDP